MVLRSSSSTMTWPWCSKLPITLPSSILDAASPAARRKMCFAIQMSLLPILARGQAMLLELDNIVAAYGRVQALKGLSLRVNEGEIVALLGANGAGKSTVLRTISGLM